VLRARDKQLERQVAIKELLQSDLKHAKRFVREAKITARLQHPGIVAVYEAGNWPNGTPYYVMKLVRGRTLRDAEPQSFDARMALIPSVIAVADTIAYAHSERVIHRDPKPANAIVGAFGETVVIDWGLAKDLTEADGGDSGSGDPYRQAAAERTASDRCLARRRKCPRAGAR